MQKYLTMLRLLPNSEQPRERLVREGPEALSEVELVALVLGSSGARGRDVLEVARELLFRFGLLHEIVRADPAELTQVKGVGDAKAARLRAAFEIGRRAVTSVPGPGAEIRCSADVARWFGGKLAHLTKEVFWAVGVDSKNRLMRAVRVAEGHLCGVEVHPREAFVPLLRMGAVGAVFVHNHPSGDPTPSGEDMALTRRLVEVGELVGVRVLDHVVVGRTGHVSLVLGAFGLSGEKLGAHDYQ